MKILRAILILSFLWVGPVFAGGSLPTDEVIALLKKNEILWKYVESTLDLDPVSTGVRLGRHFEELGGARIAPYHVRVRPKGSEDFTMVMTVVCDQKFLDKDGKEVDIADGAPSEATVKAAQVVENAVAVSFMKMEDFVEE